MSAITGYFVTWGIPAVLSLILSMVLYIAAGKLGLVRGVGVAHTSQIEADVTTDSPATASS